MPVGGVRMNTRSLLVNVGAVLAIGAVSILFAQKLPGMADGHPDLNGTWDNGSGIDFIRPQHSGRRLGLRVRL